MRRSPSPRPAPIIDIGVRAHPSRDEPDGGARARALERHHRLRPLALVVMREGRVPPTMAARLPRPPRLSAGGRPLPDALGWLDS